MITAVAEGSDQFAHLLGCAGTSLEDFRAQDERARFECLVDAVLLADEEQALEFSVQEQEFIDIVRELVKTEAIVASTSPSLELTREGATTELMGQAELQRLGTHHVLLPKAQLKTVGLPVEVSFKSLGGCQRLEEFEQSDVPDLQVEEKRRILSLLDKKVCEQLQPTLRGELRTASALSSLPVVGAVLQDAS